MLDPTSEYGRHAEQRLREDPIGWLATVRPNGQPDVVPVWFLWDNGEILIFSRPNKQKLRNIARNPRVALTLDDTRGGGDVVRIVGTASHVPEHPLADAVPAFVEKYSAHIKRIGFTPESFANEYSQAIRVRPEKIGR